jgi:hypothetical protein
MLDFEDWYGVCQGARKIESNKNGCSQMVFRLELNKADVVIVVIVIHHHVQGLRDYDYTSLPGTLSRNTVSNIESATLQC